MDIETRPSATETAQCIAGMSEKVAANPLDSDFIAEQTRIFRNALSSLGGAGFCLNVHF